MQAIEPAKPKTVEEWLDSVSYEVDPNYKPSLFALDFVNFIKLVEGGDTENKTPVVHFHMLDTFFLGEGIDTGAIDAFASADVANMCHRGIAKSTLKEYLILYIGTFHEIPGFGPVPFGLYVSDSIDNGVKKMRLSLEFRWKNSEFLQKYIPKANITDVRWEFINLDGKSSVFSGYGAKTGVRGTRENNTRPVLALLDDLVSDDDARSATIIARIEDTVYKAIEYAMHPTKRKIIWSGTPFNQSDPLYKAVESGAWKVNVYPVCESFPCTREEFRGSWEDRFSYDVVNRLYQKALSAGKIDTFNQELMLRIMSEEDRMILDNDIRWFDLSELKKRIGAYNIYITTDFATSIRTAADFSVISVWALNSNGDWFWIDGICKRQTIDLTFDDLFRLSQKWKPKGVGIEVNGQQGAYVALLQKEMMRRNIWFNLASSNNNKAPGIRRPTTTDKFSSFAAVVPWFKAGRMYFPKELKTSEPMVEAINELRLVTRTALKSKKDDFLDTISMLSIMDTWKPSDSSGNGRSSTSGDYVWDDDDDDVSQGLEGYGAYTV